MFNTNMQVLSSAIPDAWLGTSMIIAMFGLELSNVLVSRYLFLPSSEKTALVVRILLQKEDAERSLLTVLCVFLLILNTCSIISVIKTTARTELEGPCMHYIKDTFKKRIDLYFDDMPPAETLSFLKQEGWRWNKEKRCWFTYLSQEHIDTAVALGAKPIDAPGRKSERITSSSVSGSLSATPVLPRLYATPASWKDIRLLPCSTDELIACGLSGTIVFEYLMLVHALYKSSVEDPASLALANLQWLALVEFCKTNRLIAPSFSEEINIDTILGWEEGSFEPFRAVIERILTRTDPEVQFLKCVYNVDVVDFEWWRDYWDPTMCHLGHHAFSGSKFSPLSRNELYMLIDRLSYDFHRKAYPSDFLSETKKDYWIQVALWELENEDAPDPVEDSTLYIHKGRIICQTRQHRVVQATAVLSNINGADILLNVNFCTECKKFFMSYATYQHYRDRYGVILGNLKMIKREDFDGCEDCLAEESRLHLCGYSVAEKEGLSATERQRIISFVISRDVMKKDEVISHLNWLIDTHRNRHHMATAVAKWNQDLSYALQYNMEKQDRYGISALKKYQPNQFRFAR